MSAESSDSDQHQLGGEEWTVVNRNEDYDDDYHENGETKDVFSLESKIDDLKEEKEGKKAKNVEERGSSDSSDIERISEEDGLEEKPIDGSFASTLSAYSLLSHTRGLEKDGIDADIESLASCSNTDDLSVPSKDELPIDLNVERVRLYTHTPNRKLNWTLNVLMVLSVTMVVGVGIGHFVGWYGQWMNYSNQLNSHVVKLKALQVELDDCLQNPTNSYENDDGQLTACYEKIDFWMNRYTDILAENQVLQSVVQQAEEEDDKCEESSKGLLAEYRKLKFHLIEQQLENVATLRRMEVLKQQKMETLNRMKHLEVENEGLKGQVEDEKIEDEIDEQTIRLLQHENAELKEMLAELRSMTEGEHDGEKITVEEMGDLQQQVNQLKVENSELRSVIAKLRYGAPPPPPTDTTLIAEDVEPSSDYGSLWLVDSMPDLNLTGFLDYLTKVATNRETVQKEVIQLRDNLQTLSEQAKRGIKTGKEMLLEAQKSFQTKWEEMTKETATDALQNMGKVLRDTVHKLYVLGAETFAKSDEDGSSKFQKKVNKLMTGLEEQWSNIKSKVFGEKKNKGDKPNKETERVQSLNNESDKEKNNNNKGEKQNKDAGPVKRSSNELNDERNDNRGNKQKKDSEREKNLNNESDDEKNNNKKRDKRNKNNGRVKRSNNESDHEKNDKKTKDEKRENKRNDKMNKSSMKIVKEKEEKKTTENRNKRNVRYGPVNVGGNDTTESGDWVFERARNRDDKRKEHTASDWLFDRAHDRKESRDKTEVPIEREKKTQPPKWDKKSKKSRGCNKDEKKKRKEHRHHSSDDDGTETDYDSDEEVETWERNWEYDDKRGTKYHHRHHSETRRSRWSESDIPTYQQSFFTS